MIQPRRRHWGAVILALLVSIGCKPAPPATAPAQGAVASMSPAFTEMILAMGAGDRLAAVSNFEPRRAATDALPRVGDYRTVDWEKLSQIRPTLILTQYRPDKMPDGLVDRARGLGAAVVNIDIDTLDDVEKAIRAIGAAMNLTDAADATAAAFRRDLEALRRASAGRERVRALVVIGPTGLSAAGPGNFVDELLSIAGGQNVLDSGPDYPTLDRERLIELDPAVIIQLMPAAEPQDLAQADQFWRQMATLSAVRHGRVVRITDADALLPATNAPRVARRIHEALHPSK